MPSWAQHPAQQGLQGTGLHRGPREPEEAPEPLWREEAGGPWGKKPLSNARETVGRGGHREFRGGGPERQEVLHRQGTLFSAHPPRLPCLFGWGFPTSPPLQPVRLWTAQTQHCRQPPELLPPLPDAAQTLQKGGCVLPPPRSCFPGAGACRSPGGVGIRGGQRLRGPKPPSPSTAGAPESARPSWPCCCLSHLLVCPLGTIQPPPPRAAGRTERVVTSGRQGALAQGWGRTCVSVIIITVSARGSDMSTERPGAAAMGGSCPSAAATAPRGTLTAQRSLQSLPGKWSPGAGPGNATSGHKTQGRSLETRKRCSRRPGPGRRWAGDEPRPAERREQVGWWCPASCPPRSRGEGSRRQAPGPEDSVSPAFAPTVTHQGRRRQPPVLGSAGPSQASGSSPHRCEAGAGRAWGSQSLGGGSLGNKVGILAKKCRGREQTEKQVHPAAPGGHVES